LELLSEKTLEGQESVRMTTYVATAVLSTLTHPNPLMHIKRVPVVMNGKLVCTVGCANLIQALVSLDREKAAGTPVDDLTLRGNILDQLRSKPWVDPSMINVIVNSGDVELWGIVDSETEKDAIRVAVEVTHGVRQVANKLVVEHRMSAQ
jgi:osmotically-inducible protein OsmY